ncbi:MAG: hypothetical protein AAGI10_06180 [Pseudomonadota bacterium]
MRKIQMNNLTKLGTLAVAGFLLAACDDAFDPNCTPEKAARNAATTSTLGIPTNRCTPSETLRDTTGTDGLVEDAKDQLS